MATEMAPQAGGGGGSGSGGDQRGAVRRMGRERLLRYVTDIIQKQTTPLRDILRDHALPYLPVQSLHRLRAVSASWNNHISSPFFAHTQSHSHRTLSGIFYPAAPNDRPAYLPFDTRAHAVPDPSLAFLPDAVSVVASSNGLIACRYAVYGWKPRYYVCNPATTEWTALPWPAHHIRGAVALVFRPSPLNFSADYYLICAVSHLFALEVFSSKTGTWRLSNAVLLDGAKEGEVHDGRSPSAVAVAGVAYWRTLRGSVVSYDPAADRFRVVGPPPTGMPRWQLGEMDGKLCCVGAGEGVVEVHVLEEGGRPLTPSWRKLGAVEVPGDPWPLPFEGREDRVVVWVEGRVVGVEVRSGTAWVVVEGWVPQGCTDGVPYISSLAAVTERGHISITQHNLFDNWLKLNHNRLLDRPAP